MDKPTRVAENLFWLITRANTNPHELQRATGVPQPTIYRILAGHSTDPRTQTLQPLADFFKVSVSDLRDGDLRGFLSPEERASSFKRVVEVGDGDPSLTSIQKVKLRLSAGISGFEVEPEHYDGATTTVPTNWLERSKFKADKLVAAYVRGESMEPTLFEDDLVVINTADTEPVDGAVYAINYEGEPVIKRLERDAGEWWLKSDNPDQRKYGRKVCRGDTCIIVGRIVRKESEHL